MTCALTAMGAIAFGPWFHVARDINIGILFVLGVSSLGLFGIVLGGWASNSHYSIMGALRSTAQLVSYETAAGLAIVSALVLAGTLNMRLIVEAQAQNRVWFVFLAPVAFFIYVVASIAETNRAPFDLPEAESELVAGYMTEYSGFRWALYFLGEYANMIVVGAVATTLFLGRVAAAVLRCALDELAGRAAGTADGGGGRVLHLSGREAAFAGTSRNSCGP